MATQPATESGVEDAVGIRSPVYWALLGVVIERPGLYAYQLMKRYERRYGDVRPIKSPSHIYSGLNVLKSRGLIESIPGTELDTERQPKPLYQATAQGVRNYCDRLREKVDEDRRRAREFARNLGDLAGYPVEALKILDSHERAYLQEATDAAPTGAADRNDGSGLPDDLESQESRQVAQAKLRWNRYARGRFEALRRRKARRDGPPV